MKNNGIVALLISAKYIKSCVANTFGVACEIKNNIEIATVKIGCFTNLVGKRNNNSSITGDTTMTIATSFMKSQLHPTNSFMTGRGFAAGDLYGLHVRVREIETRPDTASLVVAGDDLDGEFEIRAGSALRRLHLRFGDDGLVRPGGDRVERFQRLHFGRVEVELCHDLSDLSVVVSRADATCAANKAAG